MKHPGLLALVFLLGCATGGVAAHLAVPAARADTNPTRWEYLCTQGATDVHLASLGGQGWEMVSAFPSEMSRIDGPAVATEYGFCFKRALAGYTRPPGDVPAPAPR